MQFSQGNLGIKDWSKTEMIDYTVDSSQESRPKHDFWFSEWMPVTKLFRKTETVVFVLVDC